MRETKILEPNFEEKELTKESEIKIDTSLTVEKK